MIDRQAPIISTGAHEYGRSGRRVLLVGYGTGGRRVANALADMRVLIVVLEVEPALAARARADGHIVVEGDATDLSVLREARVDCAELVAVTTTQVDEAVVRAIRNSRPEGVILTNLSPGYTDPAVVDSTARMIGRITRSIGRSASAPIGSGEFAGSGASL